MGQTVWLYTLDYEDPPEYKVDAIRIDPKGVGNRVYFWAVISLEDGIKELRYGNTFSLIDEGEGVVILLYDDGTCERFNEAKLESSQVLASGVAYLEATLTHYSWNTPVRFFGQDMTIAVTQKP